MKMLEQKWQQSFHLLCIRPRWWFPCLMLFFLWLSTPAQSSYSIIYAPKWAVNYVAFSQWFGSIFKSAMGNNTNHMKVWKLEHFPIHLNWDLDYSVQYESHQEQQWKTPEEISSNGIPQFFFFCLNENKVGNCYELTLQQWVPNPGGCVSAGLSVSRWHLGGRADEVGRRTAAHPVLICC